MLESGYKKLDTTVSVREVDVELDHNTSRTALIETDLIETDESTHGFGELEESPRGRHLGIFSTMVLFISRMVGSGIFATSSIVFESCGRSPVLFVLAWFISSVMAFCGLYVFLELGSLIPKSGGTKVFLVVMFRKPFMLMSVVFLLYSVISGMSVGSSLIFGEYFLRTFDFPYTEFNCRFVAFVFLSLTCLFHALSTKHGVLLQNLLGVMKIGLLVILFLTGIWVLLFPTDITKIPNNVTWESFWVAKTPVTVSSFSNAIIMSSYTFSGWNMGHVSSNEVKDPIRTYKIAGPASMILVALGYAAINLCYLTVLTPEEFAESGNVVGSILFEKVFGTHFGKRFLTFSIAICSAGNVFVVVYGVSRMSQEVFREGYLPLSSFMASNKPWGTPSKCILLCFLLTVGILVFAPEGGIYGYIASAESYPVLLSIFFVCVGSVILKRNHPNVKAPITSSLFGKALVIFVMGYVLLAPIVSGKNPNPKGTESWIPYPYISIIFIFSFMLYWFIIFRMLPRIGGYELTPETHVQEDGLTIKKWVKLPTALP